MDFISERLDNPEKYQPLLEQQQRILEEKYLSCSEMVNTIFPEQHNE